MKQNALPFLTQKFSAIPAPAQKSSDTSVEAAEKIAPRRGVIKGVILDAIRDAGALGLTYDEVEVRTGFRSGTVCSAIKSLLDAGAIVDGGFTRNTRSGYAARVVIVRMG